jgi:carboxylesterase type B
LDPTEIMKQNNNGFVSVLIQYRLGAFGFLGGEDVKEDGVLNAGLIDQNFALKWVQANIGKFGGDPSKVTIAGESSGAASVLYQAMAYGGKQKENLFNNVITASPWFPEILSRACALKTPPRCRLLAKRSAKLVLSALSPSSP